MGIIVTSSTDSRNRLDQLRRADPALSDLINRLGPLDDQWSRRWMTQPYAALVRTIVGQQISGAAAQAIYNRLLQLVGDDTPQAKQILAASDDDLRRVGLSRQKVAYLRDLAYKVENREVDLDHLGSMSDDDVRRQLTSVKGLGRWAADLFLLTQLQRPDVLPASDLGIRHAVQRLYALDHLPSVAEVDRLGERWQPNRSLATMYLYSSLRSPVVPT
jgi:DNA-3-methyladenine glycosylase II